MNHIKLSPKSNIHPIQQNGFEQIIDNSIVMAYRGILKIFRNPEQLFDVTLMPIIFTLMFSYIFGGAIAGGVRNYLPIIIPGILVQTLLSASMAIGVQLREDMDKGVFNRFKSLPIARISPLIGALLANIVRYLIATLLTFVMGFMIGFKAYGGITGVISAGMLVIFVAWSMSWVFIFLGVITHSASSLSGLSNLIMMPLTFLSNAFVPTSSFPKALRIIANINPISHLISAVRLLTNHGMMGPDIWLSLLGGIIFIVIFAPLSLKVYMSKA